MTPDLVKAQYVRAKAVEYAWAFLGLPYRWGGDDPILGFDCSGLVIEVLQAVGILPHGFDTTAEGLYQRFRAHTVARGYAGCLVLWLNAAGIATHVELMVDEFHTIGASGGGTATSSLDAAAAQNAFVKLRPFGYRGSSFKIVDPFKGVSA